MAIPVAARAGRQAALASAALVASMALVFGSALEHPFLPSHDDGAYVLWNPVIRAPPAEAVRGAFTTHPLGAWAPLHLLSHAADHALWGEWAGGYVLVNLALHALNAVLLAALVARLGAPPAAAVTAALLFAVHPVQVEAVVWVSQRKSVLSLAFLLASLHLWVTYARAGPGRRLAPWGLAFLAAAAALLSKAVAVVAPLALAALDVPLGRVRARAGWIVEKVPFAAAALVVAFITVATKEEIGAAVTVEGHTRAAAPGGLAFHGGSPLATFYTMSTVLPRYLRLLVWPADLSVVYLPRVRTALDAEVVASLALLALLAAAGVVLARRAPRLFCWYALSFLGLLPVSQIVPQVTLMNDRYLYVPMVGAAALAGEGLAAGLARLGPRPRWALAAAALAVAAALGVQARARVQVWRSDVALWTDAVAKAPRSPYAWYNLGRSREAVGDDEGAVAAYLGALELDGLDADSAVNAGATLLRLGDPSRAAPLVERGVGLAPGSVEAQFNLGLLRFVERRPLEAEVALRQASALDGGACAVGALLGHTLALTGRPAAAIERYDDATARGCASAELDLYRAFAESELGDEEAASGLLQRALAAAGPAAADLLRRPTVAPLAAHPGFERLVQCGAERGDRRGGPPRAAAPARAGPGRLAPTGALAR